MMTMTSRIISISLKILTRERVWAQTFSEAAEEPSRCRSHTLNLIMGSRAMTVEGVERRPKNHRLRFWRESSLGNLPGGWPNHLQANSRTKEAGPQQADPPSTSLIRRINRTIMRGSMTRGCRPPWWRLAWTSIINPSNNST